MTTAMISEFFQGLAKFSTKALNQDIQENLRMKNKLVF